VLLRPFDIGESAIFERTGPLVFEAGFGDGSFLVHLARAHPAWNILGADVSRGSISRAFRRVSRAGVDRVRLFQGKAEFLLRNVVPENGLFRMYVNFPDPWPKKRHRDRRLLKPSFLALLSTRLADQGTLLLTTDDAAYFTQAVDDAKKSGWYTVSEPAPPAAALRTKYARKWNVLQRPVYHACLTKVGASAESFPRTATRVAMHHALLTGPLPRLEAFEPFRRRLADGHIIVLGALTRVGNGAILFEVRIEEDDLTQEILIEAKRAHAAQADVIVTVSTFGRPLLTRGTREAVRAITAWFNERGLNTVETYF